MTDTSSAGFSISDTDANEERIHGILSSVLGCDDLTPTDDFFQFGGDSLQAARVVVEIRDALGVLVPVVALFEAPTAAELARWIAERPNE